MTKTKAAAKNAAPAQSKSDFVRQLLKKTAKRKNPLKFKEIQEKVQGAGYASIYRSEVLRLINENDEK